MADTSLTTEELANSDKSGENIAIHLSNIEGSDYPRKFPVFSASILDLRSLEMGMFVDESETYEGLEAVFEFALDLVKSAQAANLECIYSKSRKTWIFFCLGDQSKILSFKWGVNLQRVYPRQKFYGEILSHYEKNN